jgi:hypothetical protein
VESDLESILTRAVFLSAELNDDFLDACASYQPLLGRFSSSEPTLSALLSSEILFELLPFSNSPRINTFLPTHVPTTSFSSIAFLYRLPDFPDLQPPLSEYYDPTEDYLRRLESQLPLSDPGCDLSSFDRWAGDEVVEMTLTDEALDNMVGIGRSP